VKTESSRIWYTQIQTILSAQNSMCSFFIGQSQINILFEIAI